MAFSPADIVEAIIDELAMGDLGEQIDSFSLSRVEDGTVLLCYGSSGRFELEDTRV